MEKNFRQQKSSAEYPNKELGSEKKKVIARLYNINEIEGGFEVTLPGVFDKEREEIVGISRKRFGTREEAEKVAKSAQENIRIQSERASLEKTFTKYFYRIDETQDGKFRVVLPGLLDSKTGYYVGTTHKDFNSWNQAKEYFLLQRETEEKIIQKPLLEIQASENEKISFSNLDSFNPQVAPSEKSYDVPLVLGKYLSQKENFLLRNENGGTYQETIKEDSWEKKVFSFVSSYLEQEGAENIKDLKIKRLDALTPKQAIELSTNIVLDLSKYKYSDVGKKGTEADKNSALIFLQKGLYEKNYLEWEGNGICRNIASAVKAVFESLKANQTKFNMLRNTYCTFEAGSEHKPQRGRQFGGIDHAWNTFVTISKEGTANTVIVDTTWAKRDYETKKIEGLDHTLTRMESIVYQAAMSLDRNVPGKDEQISHILSYFQLKTERPGGAGGHVAEEEETAYFLSRALKIVEKHDYYKKLNDGFVQKYAEMYSKKEVSSRADKSEIEILWKLKQVDSSLPFYTILKGYLSNKKLDDYDAPSFIVSDNNLQKEIFEQIKSEKDFDKFIKESPKFRVRMREILPQLFIDFSPATRAEDMKELLYLIDDSGYLRSEKNRAGRTEEEIKSFFNRIRNNLRELNQNKYQELCVNLDDYQLIKHYNRIYGELKG